NMGLADLRAAVALARDHPAVRCAGPGGRPPGSPRLEATGGLRLDMARAGAETAVDFIAAGARTHPTPPPDPGLAILRQLPGAGHTEVVSGGRRPAGTRTCARPAAS